MEHARQQRRAQHLAHLVPGHAGLEQFNLLLGNEVALDNLDLVGRDPVDGVDFAFAQAPGHAFAAAAGSQSGAGQDGESGVEAATVICTHG